MRFTFWLAVAALAIVGVVLAVGIGTGYAASQTCGVASWYGTESCVNKRNCRTANGERFTGNDLTAAMPSLSHIGERWRVTYKGKSVVVRINDHGPAKHLGRVIDLSKAAAKKIGIYGPGTGHVCMVRVS